MRRARAMDARASGRLPVGHRPVRRLVLLAVAVGLALLGLHALHGAAQHPTAGRPGSEPTPERGTVAPSPDPAPGPLSTLIARAMRYETARQPEVERAVHD